MEARRSPRLSGPRAALELTLLALAWALFAPTQVGGRAAYVVVTGNSMEPTYNRGDLVILRRAAQLRLGDVAAYRYPEVGTVIHRVIARDGNTYLFKGDNNGWVDGYQPVPDEIIGKAWIHLPGVGATAVWFRKPFVLASFAALIGGVMMVASTSKPKRKKHKLQTRRLSALWDLVGTRREGTLLVLSLLFFGSGLLAFFAFVSPLEQEVSGEITYHHSLDFSYYAPANSEVYGRAVVRAGDPVFPRLTCQVRFLLDYAVAADRPMEAAGSYQVLAEVSEYNGWKRTLEIGPAGTFSGGSFSAAATIDLCQVLAVIGRVEELTGLQRTNYTVSILIPIELQGEVGGQAVQESLTPRLDFGLDETQLYVLRDPTSSADPLHWVQESLMPVMELQPASLPILGFDLPVRLARLLALLGLAFSVSGFVLIAVPLYRPGSEADARSLRLKYGSLLVRVQDGVPASIPSGAPAIELASMEDLVRLAEHAGLPVFEQAVGGEVHYAVVIGSQTYRHVLAADPPGAAAAGPDEPKP